MPRYQLTQQQFDIIATLKDKFGDKSLAELYYHSADKNCGSFVEDIVKSMNKITQECKIRFLDSNRATGLSINLREMSAKSWADILKTSYDQLGVYMHSIRLNLYGLDNYHQFMSVPRLKQFYNTEFDPVVRFAAQCIPVHWQVGLDKTKDESIAVIAADAPGNPGYQIGLERVTPCVSKMFFVSNNKQAHRVEPMLIWFFHDKGLLAQAVQELPQPMQEYAQKNNIKLR